MKKRILSLILCACLVLSIVPVMNLMPATKVHAETNTYKFDVTTDVAVGTDKGVIAENTTYHGYFTIKGTVTQRVSGGAVHAVELAKYGGGSIQFTTTTTSTVTFTVASTSGSNESGYLLYRVDDSSDVIDGSVTGTTYKEVVVEDLAAGTYQIQSCSQNRGTRLGSITVEETGSAGNEPSCTHEDVNVTHKDETAATCQAEGNLEYWYCSGCQTYFKDEGCTEAYAENAWKIAKSDHTWDAGVVTAPTCTAAGYTTYTCTVQNCGATEQRDAVAATGHTFVDGVCACGASACVHEWVTLEVIVEPTCVRIGSQRVQCSLCEAIETQIIPAAHDYDSETGKCTCSGGVLDYCGATSDTVYIKDFTDETLNTSGDWLTLGGEIRTAKDSKLSATYNGNTYQAYLKINNGMTFVLNTLADDDEKGIDGDGILILVTKSREGTDGSTKLTTLNVSVNGGEAVTVGVPRDGILVLGVSQNTTYTITKNDVENPLFYIQYVPGAILNNDTDEGEPGEPGEPGGSEGNNNTENITTITAEITDAEGNILSQHTTLTAALAAVQNGQTVCLLETNAEEVTVGSGLAVGESFKIHFHAEFTGQITPADGSVTATPTDDGYVVTRNAEPEPVDPTDGYVAYIDKDDDKEYSDGDVLYDDLSEALEIAGTINGGAYVGLVNDTTETYVIIPVGVTLDIEDCILTADYVVGFNGSYVVADRINSNDAPIGKLFVNKDIILGEEAYYDKTNTVMPVWDGTLGCYVFTKLGINTAHTDSEMTIGENEEGEPAVTFIFAHLCADVTENTYLTDGGEDNKLHIVVRLEWTVDDGTAYQDFVYSEELVSSIISGGQLFKFEMTNYEELGIDPNTLTVTAMIVSDTGVIAAGETYPKVAE